MLQRRWLRILIAGLLLAAPVLLTALFVNGGFEAGDYSGWTKAAFLNDRGLSGSEPFNGSSITRSTGGFDQSIIVTASAPETGVDPNLGSTASLKFPKYGKYCARVNGSEINYVSNTLVQQTAITSGDVDPTDGLVHIRFAYAPVLQNPAHPNAQQPYFYIRVNNLSKSNALLFESLHFSNEPGVPWKVSPIHPDVLYTDWQIADIAPGTGQLSVGDTIGIEVVGADCSQSAHYGYVYLDSFGAARLPGLTILKRADKTQVAPGQRLTYTFTYQNSGSATATNTIVKETIPANTTFASVSDNRCSFSAGVVTCALGSLIPGASGTFNVAVDVVAGATGKINNGNYTIAADGVAPTIGPLVSTPVTAGTADVAITKTAPAVVAQTNTIGYSISASNVGQTAATGVIVTDSLPSSVDFVSVTSQPPGICTGAVQITCNVGTLATGSSATISLTVQPKTTGNITNTATVSGSFTDTNPSNNSASATTMVQSGAVCRVMTDSNWFVAYSNPSATCNQYDKTPCHQGEAILFNASFFNYNFGCATHTYSWNFGDGATTTGKTAVHSFAAPGSYDVSVAISNPAQTFVAHATVLVDNCQPPSITLQPSDQSLFSGGTATLDVGTAGAGLQYQWFVISNAVATPISGAVFASYTTPALSQTTQYQVKITNNCGLIVYSRIATITVNPEPVTGGIAVRPDRIHAGESALLVWSTSGGTVTIDNLGANLPPSNTVAVKPAVTTTYKLTVQGPASAFTSSATLTVLSNAAPAITFNAAPTSLSSGGSATLSWATTGANSVTIDQGIGNVTPASGSRIVNPARTTTYTITATGDGGTSTKTVSINVNNAPAATVSSLAGTGKPGFTDGAPSVAQFTQPFAVATAVTSGSSSVFGSDASSYVIFVLDSNHTIRKVHQDGTTETWVGKPGTAGSDYGPRGVATFDFSNYVGAIVANADGSLEVIDNNLRRHVDPSGNVTNPLDSSGRPCVSCSRLTTKLPAGLAVNVKTGVIYVSNWGNHTITRVANGVETIIGAGTPGRDDGPPDVARFNGPRGLTIDSDGTVYVLDTGNNAVRKIDSSNFVSTMTVQAASGGGALTLGCCASGITPSPGGGVYVTDPGSNTVKEVGSGGSITTVAGSGSSGSDNGAGSNATFNSPLGVATAPDGSLIVADTNNNSIRGVQPASVRPRTRAVKH